MDQLLTVLIQTSPIPSHPSIALLEALFRSFQKVDGLLESKIIILCDGYDDDDDEDDHDDDDDINGDINDNEEEEEEDREHNNENNDENVILSSTTDNKAMTKKNINKKKKKKKKKKKQKQEEENHKHGPVSEQTIQNYQQHLITLQNAVNKQQEPFISRADGSIEVVVLSSRHGSAYAIQTSFYKLNLVTTPLCMIGQHDNFFIQPVPLRSCVQYMMMMMTMKKQQQQQQQKEEANNDDNSITDKNIKVKCLHFMSTATLNYKAKIQKRYGITIPQEQIIDIELKNDKIDNDTTTKTTTKTRATLIPLIFWYGRTHLSYTEHYTQNILNRPIQIGDHLEELLGIQELRDIQSRGIQEAHSDWGTYVLQQHDCDEVVYHLSGRRARAATATAAGAGAGAGSTTTTYEHTHQKTDTPKEEEEEEKDKLSSPTSNYSSSKNDTSSSESFTTARSCRAIVPGLEIVALETSPSSRGSNPATTIINKQQPKGKFKQKCFHCGLKGHSYKFCPNLVDQPKTETIDLS